MRQYKFEIIIDEGYDEYWESLRANGESGCEDLLEHIRECFDGTGLQYSSIILREYSNKDVV
jgi:hypothetical protein